MAGMFEGTVAPSVDTLRTTGTAAPGFYTDYLTGLAGAGTTALARPSGEQVAPLTAMQTAGYAAIPSAATSYQPQLGAAQATAGTAAAGATPESIQGFMNPYTQNVVQEMERLSQQNVQRNVLPSLKAGFVGSGNLGSQRYAGALGQSMADIQQNLTGQQYGALSKGYGEALQAALQQARDQSSAARAQGDLAKAEQEMGLTGAAAMTKGGAEQQAFQQAQIDAPLKTATNVSALMRGLEIPKVTTEAYKGPLAGVYGTSPLSQIAGLGSLFGSTTGGKSAIQGVEEFLKGFKSNPNAGSPSTGVGNPAESAGGGLGNINIGGGGGGGAGGGAGGAGPAPEELGQGSGNWNDYYPDLGGGLYFNDDGSIGGYTPSEPSGSGDWQQDSSGEWFDAGQYADLGGSGEGGSDINWWEE